MAHTAPRPQLTDAQSEHFGYGRVLAASGSLSAPANHTWDPRAEILTTTALLAQPDFCVDPKRADGVRCFVSVQAAISAAARQVRQKGRRRRILIELAPGRYEGLVYVPSLSWGGANVPITLYSRAAKPGDTVLVENIDAEMSGREFKSRFAGQFIAQDPEVVRIFSRISSNPKITTANASVLRIENSGFQLRNVSIVNNYNADRTPTDPTEAIAGRNKQGQYRSGQHQAVAALIAGADQVAFHHVRLSSFQDTLYIQSPPTGKRTRSYFQGCEIEGDVDFIFGQATAYFEGCEIRARGTRTDQTWITAPSTSLHAPYGFVFNNCDFTHDGSALAQTGTMCLGRQWFEGVRATPYGRSPVPGYRCSLGEKGHYDPPVGTVSQRSIESVGKCVVMRSRIGGHINPAAPWDDWNGGRYDRSGGYAPGPWNPRFRPVQFRGADFTRLLKDWPDRTKLDHLEVDPNDIFLAEYQNEMTGL